MSSPAFHCIACEAIHLVRLDDASVQRGVTSDCKPWPRCGEFFICERCGHVQKRQDAQWQADVARVYGEYEMYALTGGNEQVIFDGGKPAPRTQRLLDCFRKRASLPHSGTMLDIGCGNGSLLGTFSTLYPRWRLAGFDVHNRFEPTVRSIPGVEAFYSGTLDNVDQRFDLISMMYVVEHLPEPLQVLAAVRRLLKPGGLFLVHTSSFWDNPFDLTVVDHCSHFMVETLAATVARTGFEIIDSNDNWIAKELGVIGQASDRKMVPECGAARAAQYRAGSDQRLRWLGRVVEQARAAGRDGLGIFGTAIAGTWLASMVSESVRFFVDEDRQRSAKTHLGHLVLHPADVANQGPVYLAFPPPLAAKIQARLSAQFPSLDLIAPPDYVVSAHGLRNCA